MSRDINIPETDGEYGIGYTPEDADNDGIPDIIKETDSVPNEAFEHYQKIFENDTTFFERLGHFIRAENKAGRKAKIVKDFALMFVPYGRTIKSTTELATEIISDDMKKDKPKYLSKTVWSAILIAVVALLQALGVDPTADPELTTHIYEAVYGLAGAFGLYGLRDAISKQIEG